MDRSGQQPSQQPMPAPLRTSQVYAQAAAQRLRAIQAQAPSRTLTNWPQPTQGAPIMNPQAYEPVRQQSRYSSQQNSSAVTNRYAQPANAEKSKVQPPKESIPSAFIDDLANARQEASTLTDFTITCGDRQWSVHRLILHLSSSVLRKACSGEFKESQTRTLDLSEDPEGAVEALVDYMYRFEYDTPDLPIGEASSELAFHVLVVVIADKYNMKHFQDLATTKFRAIAESDQANDQDLTEAATIAYAAQRPTSEIRKIIASAALSKPDYFMPEEPETSAFGMFMESEPALATDVARAALSHKFEAKRYNCPACMDTFFANFERGSKYYCCPECGTTRNGYEWYQAMSGKRRLESD